MLQPKRTKYRKMQKGRMKGFPSEEVDFLTACLESKL